MSLFRIFRLIQNDPRIKRDPLLTPQSDKNLTRIGLSWFGSAYVIGLVFENWGTSFTGCDFCMSVAEQVPSILVMAQGSYAPDAMRFVLLYHTLSAPAWLVLMWIYASEFRRYNLLWWGYPYCIGLFVFASYVSLNGLAFGGAEAKGLLNKSYHHSLFISAMVTTASWVTFVVLIYFFWFYLVLVRLFRWIRGILK